MCITSLTENQKKAAIKATTLLPIAFALMILPFSINESYIWMIHILTSIIIISGIYLFIPRPFFKSNQESIPKGKLDERTIMFARKELTPGTDRYNEYYKEFPEHLKDDEAFRRLPGLLSPSSKFYHPFAFPASGAIFNIVDSLHAFVDGKTSEAKTKQSPDKIASFIKEWAKKSGALSVGFTEMKDYHWYSTGGRGDRYGVPIEANHTHSIAFTVEMSHQMVQSAPKSSIILESATQYLNAGIIATQIAEFLRGLGFESRAHIDGNYQVVAPLVARDANLGEIGRMGLLMTPKYGPRVRIGVITTNLPLPVESRNYDDSVEDFCEKCQKCSTNCPGNAISDQPAQSLNDVIRWQIDSDKCFNYWNQAGTDCGRCMNSCPYSHPNNLMHNLVRWTIRNFPNFRYWAVKMDDFFYGRKTRTQKLPQWFDAN